MVTNEFLGCQIPNSTVRPLLVIFPPPWFDDQLRFLRGQKPMLAEIFIPKLAVEAILMEWTHPSDFGMVAIV